MKQIIKSNKGAALIITVLMTVLLLFLGIYFLSFSLTEKKISRGQVYGVKTYYLAEAGVADMIWKLKNDATYKTAFESNPVWTQSFTRVNPFGAGSGSYTVSVANTGLARGEITSTGTFDIGSGKTSQRVVKIQVFKALGQSGINDNGGYADGNIDINASTVDFIGNIHSNGNFMASWGSSVDITGNLHATGNIIEQLFSDIDFTGERRAHNYPPEPAEVAMPAIDFDSSDPNSFKNRAAVVYTSAQFDNLMKNSQNLTLPGPITYVTGDINIGGGQNLTVNGILISDRDITIGRDYCRWSRCGRANATVIHPAGTPSGILAKRKIEFNASTGNININGLLYANDQLNINGFIFLSEINFNVVGAAIARKLSIQSSWDPITITFNNDNIIEALGASSFSPVITVEHWEEEY